MLMRLTVKLGFLLIAVSVLSGCAGKRPKIRTFEARAGDFIAGHGFSIGASYDPRLDKLAPKQKVLTVAIRNTSLNVIPMDARKDRWYIVDARGKKHRAVNRLKSIQGKRWEKLPERIKSLVDYPETVPIGYMVTFNLFFSGPVSLKDFEELHYENAAGQLHFKIYNE
ncbi:MAG: hypothetical protein HYW02_06625 [Deltaproteobacteria bacterium]|nr:hypothetical protein [Deltaproteobacteria bacterium]MBI2501122.1 hypothetical protein [Deltaproteobacteria bacterium]